MSTNTLSRPPSSDVPDSAEQPEEKRPSRLGLNPAQVTGSAMAAVSAAVAASWLGVAGTIIGAAIGSLFATVGSALYAQTLKQGHHVVRKGIRPASDGPTRRMAAADATVAAPVLDRAETASSVPESRTGLVTRLRALRWRRVAAATVVVLAIALGSITAFEQLSGKSVSSLTGNDDQEGTSISRVLGKSATTPILDGGDDVPGQQQSDQEPTIPDQFDPPVESDESTDADPEDPTTEETEVTDTTETPDPTDPTDPTEDADSQSTPAEGEATDSNVLP